ncbi:ABC transporter substrate-binding protein [Bifidobacterium reuteri]|uniref:ABC transporter substrate-binding protein n=1 Tax=Bifidobacterium reuteri TaxID=983706 RepID=A0A5J5EA03_9BIFI|nr:ABC transporter substrate-binding protein [Bifidobacterium reuteri]KAA8826438.1 ABC transporter substrate-binding protein [Bifidobacterium reuteri]
MGSKRGMTIGAMVCAVVMALSGCGTDSSAGSHAGSNVIRAYGVEPQNPLTPGDSGESGGIQIADQIYSTLITYGSDGSINNEMADSIEPNSDATQFTITLKDGWKFSDGTPIKAENFTKAWSYAANGANGAKNAWCFSSIKGYDELQAEGVASDAQLSGLKIVDDKTFTVDMNKPNSMFPNELGYIAFAPVPDSAFKDMKSFGQKPVTNGPYKLESWDHNKTVTLVKNPEYQGPRQPKNDGVTFTLYTKPDSAYADIQSGNLDVLSTIPASAMKSFLSNSRINAISTPGSSFQGFTIPVALEHFGMNEEGRLRRQAISMAINREQITDKIFFKTRTPATDFLAPVISGYSDSLKGSDVLKHNEDEAKRLWEQADAISPFSGTFQLAYNADADHKQWVDAVCNQLKNTFGIDAKGLPFPTSAEYYDSLDSKTPTFAFYTSWAADWPSADDFLVTLYASSSADGNGSNTGNYKNPEFDALLDKAASTTSVDEANKYYQQSEEILLQDLPTIPLWYGNANAVSGKNVSKIEFNFNALPTYWKITKS